MQTSFPRRTIISRLDGFKHLSIISYENYFTSSTSLKRVVVARNTNQCQHLFLDVLKNLNFVDS